MLRCVLAAMLCSLAAAQTSATPTERVLAVLRSHDPLRDGDGADRLLLADRSLDAAIHDLATDPATQDHVAQRRARRLWRAIELAQRLEHGGKPRDLLWWLALDELALDVPPTVKEALLQRAFANVSDVAAAAGELAAGTAVADRFCSQWSEFTWNEPATEEQREQNRKNAELEPALTKAGLAEVPGVCRYLAVPPEIAFPQETISARHQVRALLGLSSVLKVAAVMPWYVMHSGGPSLTQSSDAAMAVQTLGNAPLGAAWMQPGGDDALLAYWSKHRSDHADVLDDLVHRVVHEALTRTDGANDKQAFNLVWCAVRRLDRVLGTTTTLKSDDGMEAWRARLEDLEDAWLAQRLRERR